MPVRFMCRKRLSYGYGGLQLCTAGVAQAAAGARPYGPGGRKGTFMEIKNVEQPDIVISYALGEIKPSHIIALPLIDIKVEGVLELASVKGFSTREILFLQAVANNIGVALKAAQNRKRVQELLEETQAQSEELQAQHTELESMNAELEAQTEKLQAKRGGTKGAAGRTAAN
jgi:GAF domain-containing protein